MKWLSRSKRITINKIFVFLAVLVCSCAVNEPINRHEYWAMPVIDLGMDNLYQVDDGLYRSEQPTQQDFHNLKSLNLSEVLNLRQFHSDNDEVAGTHLTLHRIRMDAGKVAESELIEALRIIKQRNGPMLVHCWHGADRTGVTIAAYRIVFNNWSKQMALDEMLNGGFGYHAKIYPDLVKLSKNLNVDKIGP